MRFALILSTLCPAVIASSQTAGTLQGSATASNPQPYGIAKMPAGPAPDGHAFAGRLSTSQRVRRLRASTHFAAAASSSPTPGLTFENGKYRYETIRIPGATSILPGGINNAGMVVGSFDDEQGISHGFVWTNGKVQVVDYPGSETYTHFSGISNRGTLVAQISTSETGQAFAATYSVATSTWTVLPDLPGGWSNASAVGPSDEGLVTGCTSQGPDIGRLSWIWHPDTQTYSYYTVPAASEASTCSGAISSNGDIVGSFTPVYSAFASQSIFVRTFQGQYETIVSPSSWQILVGSVVGINDSETIIGLLQTTATSFPFVRTSTGVFNVINQPGYTSAFIMGINDSGVLCGISDNINSLATDAFIAYPQ